jgi:cysteine-rich repeat protein
VARWEEGEMNDGRRMGFVVLGLLVGACTNTFIDLTPDSEDVGTTDDGVEPEADVGDDGAQTVILPPPLCGNRDVDPGEECDDGNRLDHDGCTSDCRLGDGNPVPGPDPATRAYVVDGSLSELSPAAQPPEPGAAGSAFPVATDGSTIASAWLRRELPDGTPPALSARFVAADGSLARDDVIINLGSGSSVSWFALAARSNVALLAWHAGTDGIWRSGLPAGGGPASEPDLLEFSITADLPALVGLAGGYGFAWYDGTDTMQCVHDGTEPSRIYFRRLGSDGTTDGMGSAVLLDEPLVARRAASLAAGDDGTLGLLWWRASTAIGGACTLRFAAADAEVTTIADGGIIGPGLSGRIVSAEGAFHLAWRTTSIAGVQQLGFASFDSNAVLLAPPVLNDMPFGSFMGDVELAAGDHGLVAVVLGYDITAGLQLWFLRTDLLGRAVGLPAEVDPSCTRPACTFGPFNVVWSSDAFLVIYFVTLNLGEPTETTEMRMVRLVPEV